MRLVGAGSTNSSSSSRIAEASLQCSGGGSTGAPPFLKVMVAPRLRAALPLQLSSSQAAGGVRLAASPADCHAGGGAAGAPAAAAPSAQKDVCLLTLCDGAHAVFEGARVLDVATHAGEDAVVCVVGARSHVTFRAASFEGHRGPGSALVIQSGARVILSHGSAVLRDRGAAAAIAVGGRAALGIENTTLDGSGVGPAASSAVAPATKLGGAIRASGAGTAVLARSSLFSNNSANEGSVVYAEDGARLGLADVELQGNSALDVGGCVYVSGQVEVDIERAHFRGNRAPLSPGVHVFSSAVRVRDSMFEGNKASNTGGFERGPL